MRRLPRYLTALAAGLSLACGSGGSDSGPGGPPDVVLLVIDTARADHFGCYGYARPTTPNIDAFAREAVLYRHARSPAPWTAPAHASIFTGLRPGEHGLHWSLEGSETRRFSLVSGLRSTARERLLAVRLAERGYATFGVSNNPWVSERTGLATGFERFFHIRGGDAGLDEVRGWLGSEKLPRSGSAVTFALFRRSLEAGELERPFFAFFNVMEPHFPYYPAAAEAGHFGGSVRALVRLLRRHPRTELAMLGGALRPDPRILVPLYDETLLTVDAAFGELIELLRGEGIYENALIIVTSDHGEHLGEDGRYSHQLSVADALLDVPLLVKYPGGAGAGTVVENSLVSTLDVYATVLAAAGQGEAPAAEPSQDLARMQDFHRDWNLAEYYYSPAYLAQIGRVAHGFDPEPHQRIRRVVATSEGAHELAAEEGDGAVSPLPESIREELAAYLSGLAALDPEEGVSFPPEDLEQLRALGYVD